MSDEIKVSELPVASYVNDGDLLMIVQGQANKKIPAATFNSGNDTRITAAETNITNLQKNVNNASAETVVGKWINNKPLYRKIYTVAALPNATALNVALNISHLENIVRLEINATNRGKTLFFPLPYYRNDSTLGIEMYATNTNIVIVAGTDRRELTAFVIVEYTKTTDSAS